MSFSRCSGQIRTNVRTATTLSNWLQPAFGPTLELRPDLDQLEALSPERDALWSRLEKTTFLTTDEKRALIGYGAKSATPPAAKFNPGQPRVPGGQPGGGQWLGDRSETPQSIAKRPTPPKAPTPPTTPPQYRKPSSGLSGKDAAKDIPSWAKGEKPLVGEDGKTFATRLLDKKYGAGNYEKGAKSEFSQIQKYADRAFD